MLTHAQCAPEKNTPEIFSDIPMFVPALLNIAPALSSIIAAEHKKSALRL
jgi:hypothetical protein